MDEKKYILLQQTPLIHFQHTEKGATLRATDVKPRLDRFILTKIGEGNYESGLEYAKKLNWLIEKGALDYKLKIEPEGKISANLIYKETNDGKWRPDFPNIFGNLKEREKKGFSLFEKLHLTFLSGDGSILKEIEKHIETFFFCNNFGTRHSKGFGSFIIAKSNPKTYYSYFTSDVSNQDFAKLFKDIELFYKSIRNGIHDCNREGATTFYFKSLLFIFLNRKGYKWDKRLMKEKFFNNRIRNQKSEYNKKDESFDEKTEFKNEPEGFLIRDMLGLATDQQWRGSIYNDSKFEKKFQNKNNDDKISIDRFQSPILFKPVYHSNENCWKIFISYNEVNAEMFDASFELTSDKSKEKLKISTPPKNIFTMEEYFKFLFEGDSNIINEMRSNTNHSNYQKLVKIFEEIRVNKKN